MSHSLMISRRWLVSALACQLVLSSAAAGRSSDWLRFRGPQGTGVSLDRQPTPVAWNDQKDLKWKLKLPGPGVSSPIVVGDKVFVTCWSGYGMNREDPGEQLELVRHLLCVDRLHGGVIWSRDIEATLPEDPYGGMFAEHGYASHTPVSDGERVFVFFGKSGVLAFDVNGQQLWRTSVGTESDPNGWGSAASPILYQDLLIVPATAESAALVALDKATGEVRWKKEAEGFQGTWGTPILVTVDQNRTELVIAVPGEVWGFAPETGKLLWYCESIANNTQTSSAVAVGDVVYVVGARDGSTVAIRAGGAGDVSGTHIVWRGNEQAGIGTPLAHEGKLYWVNRGVAVCVDAATGRRVFQARLGGASSGAIPSRENSDRDANNSPPGRGRGGFGAGGRGGGGGMGGQDYSSPVAGDRQWYFVTRSGKVHVISLGDEFKELAVNQFTDGGEFNATPAISNGELFIRSTTHLYCVGPESRP